VLNMLNSEGS